MSATLLECLFLIVWIRNLNCEVYQERPKIKTADGDLIIEPAFDKNIYLLPNGLKSNVFVGDANILNAKADRTHNQNGLTKNIELMKIAKTVLQRVGELENKKSQLPESYFLNVSTLWSKINNLNRKVTSLETLLQNRKKDECKSNPCEHGGTCLDFVNGFHCLCPHNWEGDHCDTDVNECRDFVGTDLGCQNAATCINRPGSYECLCRSGWFGLHCTRKAKDCSGGDIEMCGHGNCLQVSTGDGITCLCHQGWTSNGTGVECSTDVNECESRQGNVCSVNPRVTCINLPGSFRCGPCPPGFEGNGYSCSDIDECTVMPNGGCNPMVSCQNTVGSRLCSPCPSGYQGDGIVCSWRGSCNINHGGCHPSAQCIERIQIGGQSAQCVCPIGMDGDGYGVHGCYISTDNSTVSCATRPCGAHGQCHILRSGFTCICLRGYGGSHCDIPANQCASSPCQNGGLCRVDDNASRGFRCECSSTYSGTLCQTLITTCGGVLEEEEGNIAYPITNTTYQNNARCAWVIKTITGKVINVTFSKFNLKEHDECLNDFLQIHDGRSSANVLIGRFCGKNLPNGGNIVSSHNYLYLWFRSDHTVSKSGFALHWTSMNPVCGGELDASKHGRISSPGSPGEYPPNRDCDWHLTTILGKRIQIYFFALDIESHPNCNFDYLAIYDGRQSSDPLLIRYCNSSLPAPIQSSSSEILVHFHSDAFGTGAGFQLTYVPVEGIPGCGGLFTMNKGDIASPLSESYPASLLCEYKIRTSPHTRIDIKLLIVDTLYHPFRSQCYSSYLKIYDGPSADSRLVGAFCGGAYPKHYTSSSNFLFLEFKSFKGLSPEGFKLTYNSICRIDVVGDSGVLKSPGYPFEYPMDTICEYTIATAAGRAIQLTFQDLNLESSVKCNNDYVEIRDGVNAKATVLGKYCGGIDQIPAVITSTHNYMHFIFRSDMSVSGAGFYANYTTIDTECGGIFRTPGTINHPSGDSDNYNDNQICTWILIAPEGMHIQLTWSRFAVEDTPSCSNDYLELIEVDDQNNDFILGKFCGNSAPPALTTQTNVLKLVFTTDAYVRLTGFSLSYKFLEKSHCGGSFIKDHGFIYSPGWPKKYQSNQDCTWTIKGPVGQQIRLNISNFDLETPVIPGRCLYADYLEIKHSSSLLGKYCGQFKSKRVVSLSNVISIHFHSDFYLGGNGFKIEWDSYVMGCGGTLSSSTGSISSPNYPGNYSDNLECNYKIVTSLGSRIRLSFIDLDLAHTDNCKDDYVEIFDGEDTVAPSLGKRCVMATGVTDFVTTTNYAYIKFRSDFSFSRKGFLLNYNTLCYNNITGRYGVIESPDFPNEYPSSLNCLWEITVPIGNKIRAVFNNFDIGATRYPLQNRPHSLWDLGHHGHRYRDLGRYYLIDYDDNYGDDDDDYDYFVFPTRSYIRCQSDYLQWKEKSEKTYSNEICGNTLPSMINTKGNTLQIKFSSGFNPSKSGFRLEWIVVGCGGHIIKSAGTISVNSTLTNAREIVCEWLVETDIGTSVNLILSELYLSDTPNCTTDAVEIYNGKDDTSSLLTRVCHRDVSLIQSTANFMFIRFTKHSNLRGTYLSSSFTSPKAMCGGKMASLSGFIYSQNYPKNYDDNLDCSWLISVPNHHRIQLSVIDLDLDSYGNSDEENLDSCGDSIKIYDSKSLENYTTIICPKTNVSKIITKYDKIMIQFTSDSYGNAKGFKIHYNVNCGAQIIAVSDGIISNDRDLGGYDKSCTWTIVAEQLVQRISLAFTHISLPKDVNANQTTTRCTSSYVRLFDGDDKEAPLIDEFCGNKVPPMIVSHGNAMTVVLGSYSGNVVGQFSAHYSPLITACGGTMTSEEGVIASPNYPHSYHNNADCEWILSTSPGNRVYITFEQFSVEYSEGCNEDYLEIRENNGSGKLLGVYCGDEIPTNTTAATKLYIKFRSNDKSSAQNSFLLHYGFLHGNDFIGIDQGEISSPLFPKQYLGAGEYSWRILITSRETIILTIDRLQIHKYTEDCINKLSIYDGYDDTAPLLAELCGVLTSETMQTTSNVAYITLILDETNTGALFNMRWTKSNKNLNGEKSDIINCGSNNITTILPGNYMTIQSPNYTENRNKDLNCEWVYQSTNGRHLNIRFQDFDLDEMSDCDTDSVSIFSSDNLFDWKTIKEKQCTSQSMLNQIIDSSRYMKIQYKKSVFSRKKGFIGQISSSCGGYLTTLSGFIRYTWNDLPRTFLDNKMFLNNSHIHTNTFSIKCSWSVKVRPGRVINLAFITFNITNKDDNCAAAVTLRNGGSVEAPFLASGKYCGYPHEKKYDITTSANSLFVSYIYEFSSPLIFRTFEMYFEEKNVECGSTSSLNSDRSWEIISSSNFPLHPVPYSECIWTFTAPPGEILRIDFIKFDLDHVDDCRTEVVELRNGPSNISPLLGRFCSQKPQTWKTSSNMMYISYSTQLAEPMAGFQANVSIDICGGTIISDKGEITSPGYPHLTLIQENTICEWTLQGSSRFIFQITPIDVDLPVSETPCGTKITIQERYLAISNVANDSATILRTICNNDDDMTPIGTSSNEIKIQLHIGKPSSFGKRGFKFSFSFTKPMCGDTIKQSEGYLYTPSYPLETNIRDCKWSINVPNKLRRIRIELLDVQTGMYTIALFNDKNFNSYIHISSSSYSETTRVFESSSNTLGIIIWAKPSIFKFKFKARFSSDEQALCGGQLFGLNGELMSPNLNRSYACRWDYDVENTHEKYYYNTILLTLTINSSSHFGWCHPSAVQLSINSINLVPRKYCEAIDTSIRIPASTMQLEASKSDTDYFNFHITWNAQPCGGKIQVSDEAVNIIQIPGNFNASLDCAWIVETPSNTQVQIKMEGGFQFGCDDEYITISKSASQGNSVIGKYCRGKTLDTPLITHFRRIFIEYHTKETNNNTNIQLMVKNDIGQCGGELSNSRHIFVSPNFPKNYDSNQECTWIITANVGNRISLTFIDRFAIEDRPNCTKDVLIIYDWNDTDFNEIARVCGRQLPKSYNSTSIKMKVVLRTDNTTNLDGFKAKWEPFCGGRYTATKNEKVVYSPKFSHKTILSDTICLYDIVAPEGEKLMIKFEEFDLQGSYPECLAENVTITADSLNHHYEKMYCGREIPSMPSLTFDKVSIVFRSYSLFASSLFKFKGFKLTYSLYQCGGRVQKSTILTTNFQNYFDENVNCTWHIQAPSNKIVVLKFSYVDLKNDDCANDFVAVFDGLLIKHDKRLALMCGHFNTNTVLRSHGDKLLLQYATDQILFYKGFKAEVLFSFSEDAGCGGEIDITATSSKTLKSFVGNNSFYEKYLDCHWKVTSPPGTVIKIKFTNFHIAPCQNANQTEFGFTNCTCDLVEIKDGVNPDSLTIGAFCGHRLPPALFSSQNLISIRLSTDGEFESSGFEVLLSSQPSLCGQSRIEVTNTVQRIKSPGFESGSVPRGLHCTYYLHQKSLAYSFVRISFVTLDLKAASNQGTVRKCVNDKIVIVNHHKPGSQNVTLGKDFVMNHSEDTFFQHSLYFNAILPQRIEICGTYKPSDLYLSGHTAIMLTTSPEADSSNYKGFEIEIAFVGFCGRNYTESQGRISTDITETINYTDCYTLITASENSTISTYFQSTQNYFWYEDSYLDIHDGKELASTKLLTINMYTDNNYPAFSTGRYMLLHSHHGSSPFYFDLNYVTSDKGRGCGGKLMNQLGRVTSPMYPQEYRKKSTCEWELETPYGTRLKLQFSVFDLGKICDQNYLQLVNSMGNVISSFCTEQPADYTSDNNYVKVVFVTSVNNGGSGWVADFIGII